MKKLALFLCALLAGNFLASAQQTWFCSKPGAKLTYVQKDARGKINNNGGYSYIIRDVDSQGGKTTILFDAIIVGLDGVAQDPVGCKVWSADGYFHTDARASMGQYGEAFSFKGHGPIIPENPSVGEKLDDSTITLEALATTANFTNARMSRHEEITTDAGTFDCWCLEYNVNAKVTIIKTESSAEIWLAKGVGVVRQITRDKKGKVTQTVELSSIE